MTISVFIENGNPEEVDRVLVYAFDKANEKYGFWLDKEPKKGLAKKKQDYEDSLIEEYLAKKDNNERKKT